MNCLVNLSYAQLKWLIERSHTAYLSHIGLWLASMLGVVTILTRIASNLVPVTLYKFGIFIIFYGLLVFGMGFAVYRIAGILKEHIEWAKQLKDPFRHEILSRRGKISLFVVDAEGDICIPNRNFIILTQTLVAFLFFILANLVI